MFYSLCALYSAIVLFSLIKYCCVHNMHYVVSGAKQCKANCYFPCKFIICLCCTTVMCILCSVLHVYCEIY